MEVVALPDEVRDPWLFGVLVERQSALEGGMVIDMRNEFHLMELDSIYPDEAIF